jgi:hypothetical protein
MECKIESSDAVTLEQSSAPGRVGGKSLPVPPPGIARCLFGDSRRDLWQAGQV